MHGDMLNRGQGLLPYGGPGCKSESRRKGGGWLERETRHLKRWRSISATKTPLKSPDVSQDCCSTTTHHYSLNHLPPHCHLAPAAPQGAAPSGVCVELAASLRLVFFLLLLGGFKWAVILTFLSFCFLKQVHPLHHHPSFSFHLSLSLCHSFLHLSIHPAGGEGTFKPSPCGRQACQGCFVGNCLSHTRCLSAHTCRPPLMPRSKRGGHGLCRLNLLPDCSSVLIKQASVVFWIQQ